MITKNDVENSKNLMRIANALEGISGFLMIMAEQQKIQTAILAKIESKLR